MTRVFRPLSGISTHTLTWSVTLCESTSAESLRISTHTLTWSVTVCLDLICPCVIISTHTLTWSVTNCSVLRYRKGTYFNSHAHVERDENRLSTPFDANISTHTLTWSVTLTEEK